MGTIKLSTTVDAPVERVFDVFTDLERAAERIEGIQSIELLSDDPVGEGTRWKETRVVFNKPRTEELWIAAIEAPNSYTVQGDTCGADFFTTFAFVPDGTGTRVDMEVRTKARTIGAKLLSPLGWLFAGSMKKLMQKDIDDLKRAAESE